MEEGWNGVRHYLIQNHNKHIWEKVINYLIQQHDRQEIDTKEG
jgi:hypothetical protein